MLVYNMMTGPLMVNTYLGADPETKKAFIVDPGGYSREMVDLIAEEGYEILYIILTHGHGDHICGVEKFMETYPQAKLVAAKAEEEMLADPRLNMSTMTCGMTVSLHPHILVEEGDTIDVGDIELRFVMTPGHTKGGMCIITEKAVFSGDTLFNASIGRTDFPGGSYEELLDSIRTKLFVLPDDTDVYPGHMGPTSIGFEKKNNPFL